MLEITENVFENSFDSKDVEVFWAYNHSKVVFFRGDDFDSFINLSRSQNNYDTAVEVAKEKLSVNRLQRVS